MIKISYPVTSLILGVSVAAVILFLVRRNRLHVRFSVWWLSVAGASILLGAFPRLVDKVARFTGVHYPPTLLLTVGMALILIKMLTMDMDRSLQERKIRLLTQRLAVFEGRHEHCLPVPHTLEQPVIDEPRRTDQPLPDATKVELRSVE